MNVLLAAVVERTGESGVRRAVGASPSHIPAQFVAVGPTFGIYPALRASPLSPIDAIRHE
ncbi:MAG: hypothetical protein JWL60_629 [Gemmatimonadetes bacterium]|jgi:ABC-type antimicrobial peptide transport system permease subunit|nr:hypothetical protein [Gemmatimonadota bacterium]